MATVDELKAQRDRLSEEYQAIQAEFSAGKEFLSGAAEADREAREAIHPSWARLSEVCCAPIELACQKTRHVPTRCSRQVDLAAVSMGHNTV